MSNDIQPVDGESLDVTEHNIEQLKQLFPSVFTEGKIDFDALKSELGEYVETNDERYQFTWAGKEQAKRIATTPTLGTLRPAPEESVDWNNTENLYIEGDNLEVLKLLQKSYFNKVKMIYIDPPYNTGKDFVYKDDYKDNLANYQRLTGQLDEEGNPLSTNRDSAGRYHSNWLNMMYPRLKTARNLLADDGVIFVSIDDNEVHNLRKVCDEVFGGEQFIAIFPWKKRTAKSDVPYGVSQDYEWVLTYSKNKTFLGLLAARKYNYTKDYPNNGWRLSDLTKQTTADERPNSAFNLIDPKTGKEYPYNPNRTWSITKETFQSYYDKGKIVFPDDYDFLRIKIPAYRVFESEDKEKSLQKFGSEVPIKSVSTMLPTKVGLTEDGNKIISDLFNVRVFPFSKPVEFIKFLISLVIDKNFIVLDFFSGSATTAHATMQLNAEDNGNRKFIMVQIPEPTPEKSEARKAGYDTIAEIGKERIRRAAAKIREEHPDTEADLGFKVFKLDTSNIKKWQPTVDTLADDLFDAVDNIEEERTPADLLYEVLLKYGLPLTLPVEEITLGEHTAFNVAMGSLVACFDENITLDTVQAIIDLATAETPVLRVVFRDSGFKDDIVKTNAIQRLKQAGIEDILSI